MLICATSHSAIESITDGFFRDVLGAGMPNLNVGPQLFGLSNCEDTSVSVPLASFLKASHLQFKGAWPVQLVRAAGVMSSKSWISSVGKSVDDQLNIFVPQPKPDR
jgi:hypothetical protein